MLFRSEVTKQANKRLNAAKNKLVPTKEELFPNTKFVENAASLPQVPFGYPVKGSQVGIVIFKPV